MQGPRARDCRADPQVCRACGDRFGEVRRHSGGDPVGVRHDRPDGGGEGGSAKGTETRERPSNKALKLTALGCGTVRSETHSLTQCYPSEGSLAAA